MSNRTLIELNHDYCPPAERIGSWAEAMVAYMRCGDRRELPTGVMHIEMRHHSELSVIETLRSQLAAALEAQQKAERERDVAIAFGRDELERALSERDEARATIQRYSNPWTVEIQDKITGNWQEFAHDVPLTLAEAEARLAEYQADSPRASFRIMPHLNPSQFQEIVVPLHAAIQRLTTERDEAVRVMDDATRQNAAQVDRLVAEQRRLEAEKREMREDKGLSHEDWMSLSRAFNAVAYRHMSLPAEHRINEYLKVRISAALAGSPAAEGTKETATEDGRDGMPLRASFKSGVLLVSIGAKTLAFAFENAAENNPYDYDSREFTRRYQISDRLQFADDVCRAMNDEGEDGSTPLTRFLDQIMNEAVEQGSLGIHDPEDEEPKPAAADEAKEG